MTIPAHKVLIVEDNDNDRLLLTRVLQKAGYLVWYAWDAFSVLPETRKFKPEVIVLDMGLPGGGGMAVLDRLQRQMDLMQTPIIVYSGHDDEILSARLGKYPNVRSYLVKTATDWTSLLEAVGAAVSQGEKAEGHQ